MAYNLLMVLVLCSALSVAYARSDGAPTEACLDMMPQHGVDAQTSQAPYTITLSDKHISNYRSVYVTIEGKSKDDTIKGFMIQARNKNDEPIGSFSVSFNDKGFMKTISCGNGVNNALTHVKHAENEDRNTFSVRWLPPITFTGDVTFYSTIARNGGVFWVAVPSEILNVHY